MMGLLDSERISMICSAVLIQSTRVTDRRTDGVAVAYTRVKTVANHATIYLPNAIFRTKPHLVCNHVG